MKQRVIAKLNKNKDRLQGWVLVLSGTSLLFFITTIIFAYGTVSNYTVLNHQRRVNTSLIESSNHDMMNIGALERSANTWKCSSDYFEGIVDNLILENTSLFDYPVDHLEIRDTLWLDSMTYTIEGRKIAIEDHTYTLNNSNDR